MIYHIYWGTSGSAGLYLDDIYKTLDNGGFKQKAFVSYYYPFNYGEKVFFKITDFEHCRFKGVIRKMLMGIELVFDFIKIIFSSMKDKPKLINYSYVSVGSPIVYYFLRFLLKLNRCKLVITCHDVIPNVHDEIKYNKEVKLKKRIYRLADYYLIHNPGSAEDLKSVFTVDGEKIVMHPFPIMDLSKMNIKDRNVENKYDFLFIGHMRKEKGVDLLIEAWYEFHRTFPQATLCIAGNPAYYRSYIEEQQPKCLESNIEILLGFVKDEDYVRLVKESNCVVFPYTSGTNSGVISTVLSLGRDVIVSDLGMFTNNPLVSTEYVFKCGEKESLIEKMTCYYTNRYKETNSETNNIKNKIDYYRQQFDQQVVDVYSRMLNEPNITTNAVRR